MKCPSQSRRWVSMHDTRELELAHLNGLSQSFSCFDKSKSLPWKWLIVCALAKETQFCYGQPRFMLTFGLRVRHLKLEDQKLEIAGKFRPLTDLKSDCISLSIHFPEEQVETYSLSSASLALTLLSNLIFFDTIARLPNRAFSLFTDIFTCQSKTGTRGSKLYLTSLHGKITQVCATFVAAGAQVVDWFQ